MSSTSLTAARQNKSPCIPLMIKIDILVIKMSDIQTNRQHRRTT
jgi:hypothetical protein